VAPAPVIQRGKETLHRLRQLQSRKGSPNALVPLTDLRKRWRKDQPNPLETSQRGGGELEGPILE